MCLAQGPQHSDTGETQTLRSRVKHSTTEPLLSLKLKWPNKITVKSLLFSIELDCLMEICTDHDQLVDLSLQCSQKRLSWLSRTRIKEALQFFQI